MNVVIGILILVGVWAAYRYVKNITDQRIEGCCKTCEKEIAENAKTCPNCGERNPHAKVPNSAIALMCLAGLIAIGQFQEQSPVAEKRDAYYMCKHFIKERLNDPRSIEFPHSKTAIILQNGNTYKISGTFSANNAFGAKIKKTFICNVTENQQKGTWTLDYLSEF